MPPQGYGLPPNPRNPFIKPQQGFSPGYPQSKSDYEGDSELGDGYGSANASTTRLAGSLPFYDQNGELTTQSGPCLEIGMSHNVEKSC